MRNGTRKERGGELFGVRKEKEIKREEAERRKAKGNSRWKRMKSTP